MNHQDRQKSAVFPTPFNCSKQFQSQGKWKTVILFSTKGATTGGSAPKKDKYDQTTVLNQYVCTRQGPKWRPSSPRWPRIRSADRCDEVNFNNNHTTTCGKVVLACPFKLI